MKTPIVRLYVFFGLLFAVLIAFTSRWSVFEAKALRDQGLNHRDELTEQRIHRGTIRTADHELIAGSRKRSDGSYRRRYPLGELFGHPVGYSYANLDSSGLEKFYADRLVDRRTELVGVFDSLLGRQREGQNLETTLRSDVQKVATDALKASPSGKGAAVAMDVKTGAVRAMVSVPGYDPTDLDVKSTYSRLATDNDRTPLVDRATQGLYPPGSTFKALTAAAALDTGDYTPESTVSGRNGKVISGVPLQNFGGEDFGPISLTFALTNSVNTVFGEIGEKLGKTTMKDYMEKFGFDDHPPIDLPETEVYRSGERTPGGRLIKPTSSQVDVGRMAIGQDKLLVTPLQMASVAQTIGNGGVRMKPYLVQKAFDADGRTKLDRDPEEAERAISANSAAALTGMMKQVVREGTGTAAALTGVEVAGKTGTAELNNDGLNDLWFICFTDQHAVAVVVERVQGGTGGVVAAPIAKAMLEALGD